jgi:glycosyltransferase involved in cell wall biosynthesis
MHILQINTEKGWRGGERQTLLSMQGLRRSRIRVSLLCLKNRPLYQKALEDGFAVNGVGGQLGALLHLLFFGRRYSIIHAQSSRAFGFASIASLLVPTPLVYTRRVDFVPRGALTRWKYHRATALVAISHAIAAILRNAGMGNADVISSMVVEREPDGKRAAALKEHLDGKAVVGVVAALVGHKDPLTMVRAAAAVIAKIPDTVFLHFGDGTLRPEVEQAIRNHALGNHYRLMGHCSGVEDYFQLFNCFAMSSSEEGLGSSVLDAFYAGIPVAATSAGGLAELVGGRGLLSPVRDPEALATNIIALLSNREKTATLTAIAKRYVTEEHGVDVLTAKYIMLYKRLAIP